MVPAVDGKPAPGYVVGKATADPRRWKSSGRKARSNAATEALTEPVSVAGARERVRETVTLGLLDPALRLKTPRPRR